MYTAPSLQMNIVHGASILCNLYKHQTSLFHDRLILFNAKFKRAQWNALLKWLLNVYMERCKLSPEVDRSMYFGIANIVRDWNIPKYVIITLTLDSMNITRFFNTIVEH